MMFRISVLLVGSLLLDLNRQSQCHNNHVLFGILTTAQAFSSVARSFPGAPEHSHRLRNPTTRHTSCRHPFFSSNPNINGEGAESNKESSSRREGKTGWNHSQPSESSSFWGSEKDTTSSVSESSTSSDELRTGWLHYKKPQKTTKKETGDSTSGTSLARRRLELAMKQQERNHRIVAPPTFHATGAATMMTTEHVMSVPLNRTLNTSPRIDVYFCIVEKVESLESRASWEELTAMPPQARAKAYVERAALQNADSLILYLQGGPGFGAPTPVVSLGIGKDSSWAAKALESPMYSRVVLMDQRGTGRSTPITKQTLELKFPNLVLLDDKGQTLEDLESSEPQKVSLVRKATAEATEYMTNFRADNIVQDAEEIRDALLLPAENKEDDMNRPWGCALGQSFGGFCLLTYLSKIEHPPKVCLFTGGIAPMLTQLDQVYSSLWERVKERSLRYYDMYVDDVKVIKTIVRKLLESPARLPSGGTLTARRFLQLGLGLGGQPSTFASLHALFSSALVPTGEDEYEFSRAFLKKVEVEQSFDDHPIYFWLHESIYANKGDNAPTNWSAHRMYESKVKAAPEFDYRKTSALDSPNPTLFFGEMVFPWMAEDYAELSGVGLQQVANALASKEDWSPLYDADNMKRALSNGQSRAAAAVYYEDMYVDFDACAKVFARGGPLEKCKVYITNEYCHSGLRDDGAKIFDKLHGMATGSVRTPS